MEMDIIHSPVDVLKVAGLRRVAVLVDPKSAHGEFVETQHVHHTDG